ncbi:MULTISPECIES: gluconokinase [unclassified Streptomyces]|uniref:gluconokinase n=1 Tax=unclassified Streptomyces TaxID=2593676 RepID=UPI0022B6D055|nr:MULTISPECIES: gluconokinase [unclassified Streptomyces]MCZ7413196.1 gluconokinase [Streptomyces sp. WMMC897]MCZ7430189.1 gluconokinase [Streptomyces sp. WMMC1477]
MVLVVMGVSGSGKSTIARRAADHLAAGMIEADAFHPPANIEKMAAGQPLTDADRLPWLRDVRDEITARAATGAATVVSCSALKRSYRDVLRGAAADVRFVHLDGTAELIAARLHSRTGHFMPAALLDSQLADLEPLAPDENGVSVGLDQTPEEITKAALAALGLGKGPPGRTPAA